MAEKGLRTALFPAKVWQNSWFYLRFPILVMVVCMGILVIYGIDELTIKTWRKQHYPLFNISNSNLSDLMVTSCENGTCAYHQDIFNATQSPQHLVSPNPKKKKHSDVIQSPKLLVSPKLKKHSDWISVELEKNFTSNLLTRWMLREPCMNCSTFDIHIPLLDGLKMEKMNNLVELSAGDVHSFDFQAMDESGNPKCLGGDYFELDLSSELWKSRPPIEDHGNGSYSFSLQVHQDFVGEFNLTIILLYKQFQGLRYVPEKFVYQKELRLIPVKFHKNNATALPELKACKVSDFSRTIWAGRWTRHGRNDDCEISHDGRYRCLEPDFPCKNPWCFGSLGSLESNGWVYSSHCSFKIFSQKPAWDCLKNRWIFFWGDSNHVDSIRNLLNFVLGLTEIAAVPRRFDMNFTNPLNSSESVRITSIFNGHWNDTMNYEGLNSLSNGEYRDLLKRYFSEATVPDTMIMNSGLHDIKFRSIRSFTGGADFAAMFWKEVIDSVKARNLTAPKLLYRTTVTTGGYARGLGFNPQKMEVYNDVVLDKLREHGILSGVIDDFDMTFPWHYDNRCNDGVHYGRAPAKARWRDGEIGHQYFVDLMLVHVILNALCAAR
ncbi:hypothetical protein MKW92_021474 [Papaver armeniacum]|nr:hypothetical protein MKW92_021474 [Papaver armeniacum]